MNFKVKAIALSLALASTSPVFATGIPVVDAASISQDALNYAQEIENMVQQVNNQIEQINQLKSQVTAMTGGRELGDLVKNSINDTMGSIPDDLKDLYNLSDVSVSLDKIKDVSNLDPEASMKNLAKIAQFTQDYFEKAQQRLANIKSLQEEINNTQDVKAAADLQSRIGAEQVAMTAAQSELDQAYRMYEINEKMIGMQQQFKDRCDESKAYTGTYFDPKCGG